MKHTLILTLLTTLLATSAYAQTNDPAANDHYKHKSRGPHSGPPSAERMVEHLGQELDLSAEQAGQLLTVLKAAEVEREALQEQAREQMKPEFCALHLDTQEQIRTILTEDQSAALDQIKAERMQRRSGKSDRFGSAPDCSEYES